MLAKQSWRVADTEKLEAISRYSVKGKGNRTSSQVKEKIKK